MTNQNRDDAIARALIADANDSDAWERVGVVPASRSRRPSWYGKSRVSVSGERVADATDERFRAAYDRYYRRVVAYYRRGFNLPEEAADDLAQQAFLRFYAAMDEYRGEAEWALLETIAHSVALNRVRTLKSATRNAREISIEDVRSAHREPSHPSGDAVDRETVALRRKRLHDAIAALSPGQRRAMQLWLDGFRYSEIASALDASIDAVRSRLREAKRHLRASLEDDAAAEMTVNDHRGANR